MRINLTIYDVYSINWLMKTLLWSDLEIARFLRIPSHLVSDLVNYRIQKYNKMQREVSNPNYKPRGFEDSRLCTIALEGVSELGANSRHTLCKNMINKYMKRVKQ